MKGNVRLRIAGPLTGPHTVKSLAILPATRRASSPPTTNKTTCTVCLPPRSRDFCTKESFNGKWSLGTHFPVDKLKYFDEKFKGETANGGTIFFFVLHIRGQMTIAREDRGKQRKRTIGHNHNLIRH